MRLLLVVFGPGEVLGGQREGRQRGACSTVAGQDRLNRCRVLGEKNLVRNFSNPGVLSWICNSNHERLAQFSAEYPSTRHTRSFDEILADPKVAGVAVATPVDNHGRFVRRALLAGKDVFVEKPLCLVVEKVRSS